MVMKNEFRISKTMVGLILGLIMGFCVLVMPGIAGAYQIEVSGDGVNSPTTLYQVDLETMDQEEQIFSTNNTWPTKKWYVGEGPTLMDILDAAGGLTQDATLIKFTATDNFNITLTKEELLDATRYYYPGLKENHPYYGEIAGSTDDAEEVVPIIALQSANSDDFEDMTASQAPHLLFGQRYVTEQTNNLFAKWINKIEVFTTTPQTWADPTASISSGTIITSGTEVTLSATYNDADKVYYTTDGSTPSIASDMYNWIAYRWWTSRSDVLDEINHPIEITGTVGQSKTIKALVIGPGKYDSSIATFTYTIGNASPTLTADTTNNSVGQAIDITFTDDSSWRSAITDVTVNESSIAGHYTVTAGNLHIDNTVFTSADTYSVVVTATNYTNAEVNQVIVP